jgi:hypothetical protein
MCAILYIYYWLQYGIKKENVKNKYLYKHVHEKVLKDRIAELLALFVIRESALYFEGLLLF